MNLPVRSPFVVICSPAEYAIDQTNNASNITYLILIRPNCIDYSALDWICTPLRLWEFRYGPICYPRFPAVYAHCLQMRSCVAL